MHKYEETYENFQSRYHAHQLLDETDRLAKCRAIHRLNKVLKWNAGSVDLYGSNPDLLIARIRHLLYLAETWFSNIQKDSDTTSGTVQLVAYSIAKLCYWDWIEDSRLVGQVLNFIYKCDGHFSAIFQRVFDSPNQKYHVWHLSRNSTDMKELSMALYFLHHGQRCRLVYEGIRMVDTDLVSPMTVPTAIASIIYVKPRPLLLFLRYGAQITRFKKENTIRMSEWGSAVLLRHLIRMLWINLGDEANSNETSSTNLRTLSRSNNMQKVCQCINVLLRVTPQLDKRILDFPLISMENGRVTRYNHSETFVEWVSKQGILPNLSIRCYQPSPLQHFCRCRIRNCLNSNDMLPFGIRELQIPEVLKKYLDLLED